MKGILGIIAFIVVGGFIVSITGNPGNGLNGFAIVGMRIAAFLVACTMLYQAYDAFRSAFTGNQPQISAPNADPRNFSARLGGIAWGVIALLLALTILSAWIFRWGPWKAYYGG